MKSTEQERATREDFEHWATSTNQGYDLTRNQSGRMQTYEYVKTDHAWRGFFHGWQSASIAPVVPNELHEAAQAVIERWDSPNWKDLPATADYIARLRNALAASPQPPEAECQTCSGHGAVGNILNAEPCPSCSHGSPYACTCTFKTNRNSAPSCFEAEPVQLPELLRKLRISAKRDGELGRDSGRTDEIEQQVRQLLAAHGIKVIE